MSCSHLPLCVALAVSSCFWFAPCLECCQGLCWWPQGNSPGNQSNYPSSMDRHGVDIARMTLLGPSLSSSSTCVAGAANGCVVTLDGVSDADRALVLETCGNEGNGSHGLLMLGATSIYNDFTCISGQLCELDDVVRGFVQDQDCFVQAVFKHSQTFMANLWWSKPSPFCGFSKDEYEIYTI